MRYLFSRDIDVYLFILYPIQHEKRLSYNTMLINIKKNKPLKYCF